MNGKVRERVRAYVWLSGYIAALYFYLIFL